MTPATSTCADCGAEVALLGIVDDTGAGYVDARPAFGWYLDRRTNERGTTTHVWV
jgi:hypothetical protein